MRIIVHYMAQLKRIARTPQENVDVAVGTTMAGLLLQLAKERDDAFRQIVLCGQDQPHPSLLLFVGDEQIAPDSHRTFQEGDIVTLLTPMAGG